MQSDIPALLSLFLAFRDPHTYARTVPPARETVGQGRALRQWVAGVDKLKVTEQDAWPQQETCTAQLKTDADRNQDVGRENLFLYPHVNL